MSETLKLYIDGQWVGSDDNDKITVINPATERPVSTLYKATKKNLEDAVSSAEQAFKSWSRLSGGKRGKILRKASELLSERHDEIAKNLTLEQGKPLGEAKGEVHAAIQSFVWASEQATNINNINYPAVSEIYSQHTVFEPVGVVAAFTPWNFPAMLPARKIANALAAGCCIIIKPAEETPATTIALAQALHDAGLPAGVLNMVFGDPAQISEHLINAKSVRLVTLTGSTAIGKLLARMAADTLTPCILELGGHAPVLVFDDVDVAHAAKMLASFKFRNAGQVCVSPSRFFIHKNIAEKFNEHFLDYASNLIVGDGIDAETEMGPLAHERRLNDIDSLVSDAINKGANCILGGKRTNRDGYFYQPTILTDVPDDAEMMQSEIFGPIAVLSTFDDTDDVISRANNVSYGLASYLFTASEDTIDYVKPRLEAGLVSINITTPILENVPFGGVKESGYGLEGGEMGLHTFLNSKLIHKARP